MNRCFCPVCGCGCHDPVKRKDLWEEDGFLSEKDVYKCSEGHLWSFTIIRGFGGPLKNVWDNQGKTIGVTELNARSRVDKPFPFDELKLKDKVIRTWPGDLEPTEMVWHQDPEDRTFKVIKSKGWQFQRDNELPEDMTEGRFFNIKKGEYHRGIMGEGPLVVEIIRNPK